MSKNIFKLNSKAKYDVLGIGSALLDLTVQVDDEFLSNLGLTKGGMHLVTQKQSKNILDKLSTCTMEITPGGSSANTLAGISNFVGKAIFIGTVGNDEYGQIYITETKRSGVKSQINRHNSITGHAITFITSDSERTFATHLGAALNLKVDNLREEDVANSKIIHLEGYLFENPELQKVCLTAIDMAHKNNVLVSVDLSDSSLIDRIYDVFDKIVREHVDILFVNEDEAFAFTKKREKEALKKISEMCQVSVVKLGARGSLVKALDEIYEIPVYKTNSINTNGAGDMYAAGFLYGIAEGLPLQKAGRFGSYASSLVVAQSGARISGEIDLSKII